jgi:excisionase family DNA binding protein
VPGLLSPKEVATRCGLKRRAIYKAIERGELPAYKLCERLRIDPADFDIWLEGQRVVPREPIRPPTSRAGMTRNGLRHLLDMAEKG